MLMIVIWLVIGIGLGAALTSFRSGAGTSFSFGWSIAAGVVGSLIGGFGAGIMSPRLFGEGPEALVSFAGAAILAFVAVLAIQMVKR